MEPHTSHFTSDQPGLPASDSSEVHEKDLQSRDIELAHRLFHQTLLTKSITSPAQIQDMEKQIPPLMGKPANSHCNRHRYKRSQ